MLTYLMFMNEKIPMDKKSIALNVTIQSMNKPLNDNDLENLNKLIIDNVRKRLVLKFDLKLNEHY